MNKKPLKDCYIYLCTPFVKNLLNFLEITVKNGVDLIQLREKNLSDKDLLAVAKDITDLSNELNCLFIVNDRPDIALASSADGVHVGQDDMPPTEVRKIIGDDKIVGLSTHSTPEIIRSNQEPVDYISVGPISPTPTKPGRPPTGVTIIQEAATLTSRPFFITGGITPEKISELSKLKDLKSLQLRYVVVRYLVNSDNPAKSAAALKEAVKQSAYPSSR